MSKIYLINNEQFINDLHTGLKSLKRNMTVRSLHFVKNYYDVQHELSFLIPDLVNIIMTYVNDEFEMIYVIKLYDPVHVEIYFSMNCNICSVDYIFDFSLYIERPDMSYKIFIGMDNNIISSDLPVCKNPDIFGDYKSWFYMNNFNYFFNDYAIKHGMYLPNIDMTYCTEDTSVHIKNEQSLHDIMIILQIITNIIVKKN